ncbi:hypothetical protein ABLA85_15680 [Xenorhabdus sp. SGI246]
MLQSQSVVLPDCFNLGTISEFWGIFYLYGCGNGTVTAVKKEKARNYNGL